MRLKSHFQRFWIKSFLGSVNSEVYKYEISLEYGKILILSAIHTLKIKYNYLILPLEILLAPLLSIAVISILSPLAPPVKLNLT